MISFLFPSPNSADVFATSPQYTEDMDQKHPKGVSRTGFQDSFMVRESGFSLLKVKYLKIKKAHVYLLQTGALTQLLGLTLSSCQSSQPRPSVSLLLPKVSPLPGDNGSQLA